MPGSAPSTAPGRGGQEGRVLGLVPVPIGTRGCPGCSRHQGVVRKTEESACPSESLIYPRTAISKTTTAKTPTRTLQLFSSYLSVLGGSLQIPRIFLGFKQGKAAGLGELPNILQIHCVIEMRLRRFTGQTLQPS